MSHDCICPDCFGYMLDMENKKNWKKCLICGYCKKIGWGPMISKEELLKDRDKQFPDEYTQTVSDNLNALLIVLNKIREKYGKPMLISSGWRPKAINDKTSNSAAMSNHMLGLAADIRDMDRKFMHWCLDNLEFLSELGVYMEDFRYTPSWLHIQIVPPKSGKRIYIPSTNPASDPGCWSGEYPSKYDK